MIKIKNIKKSFSNGFIALKGINLHIGKDEFVYIVGPSGAGKSTLLKMLFKADAPTEGDILIDNISLNNIHPKQIPYLRRNIGVIFQDFQLIGDKSIEENIAQTFFGNGTGIEPHCQILDFLDWSSQNQRDI